MSEKNPELLKDWDDQKGREFISSMMMDPTVLADLSETVGEDATPILLQAICREVVKNGIELMELKERVDGVVEGTRPLVNGLLGFNASEPKPEWDTEYAEVQAGIHDVGRRIREGAGLEPLGV
ncbi:MAG: hypothetical protein WAM97_18510 [Acidimicrobiales bacterium]